MKLLGMPIVITDAVDEGQAVITPQVQIVERWIANGHSYAEVQTLNGETLYTYDLPDGLPFVKFQPKDAGGGE